MFKSPFSFNGRIRRTEYGISVIIYVAFYVAFKSMQGENADNPLVGLLFIPLLYFIVAQNAKRCHDLGKSGWWQLIPFYSFWLLFENGEYDENEFGPNPKDEESDVNKVQKQNE
jgi:uncharacterized membrane protein YhaH (DUF805 family)